LKRLASSISIAAALFLCVPPSIADEVRSLFDQAEAAFQSRNQEDSIPLFQQLIDRLEADHAKRPLTDTELDYLSRSLDALSQVYFNRNDSGKTNTTLLQLIELNPVYKMDEDLVT